MSDEVWSLKGLFTTAVLALAIDLLFVFPVSHFSEFGKAATTAMAKMYGFIPDVTTYMTTSAAAAPVVTGPAGVFL